MTDTPRRRPPAPTRAGTLSLAPRRSPRQRGARPTPHRPAKPETRDWRKPATGAGRNRGKASFPEQANTEPVRRSADAGGDRRPSGRRPPARPIARPARRRAPGTPLR
jgi:hypothetical protein